MSGVLERRSTPARSSADVLELAPDVPEHVTEVVPLAQLLASARQPLHQVLEPSHVQARRVAASPATFHQPPKRLAEIAFGHHVVR